MPGPTGRRHAIAVVVLAIIASLVIGSIASAQQSRLKTRSSSTFTLDPDRQRVDVVTDIVITNLTPPSVRSGPCQSAPSRTCRITTNYYTDSWGFLSIQHGARGLRIRGPGVTREVAGTNDTYTNYRLGFRRLQRGDTARIRVTYHLPAARPRSPASTRISPAYAHFCWHGQATQKGTVTALLPRGYEPTTQGTKVRVGRKGKRVKVVPAKQGRPSRFFACTDSVDTKEALETQTVSPSGQTIVVRGWPDDPDWTEQVTTAVADTLPALEALIGTPFPSDGLTIVEVASSALGGYAGDYSGLSGDVRVGEGADDPIVVTHELAHAWFNRRTLDGKWLAEGAAEWVARTANDDDCEWRSRPVGDEAVPKLRRWELLGPEPTIAERKLVSAQYFMACDIFDRAADLAGEEHFRAVLASLLERSPKYGGTPDPRAGKPDWREWLDAVEEIGMAPNGWLPNSLIADELVAAGVARPKDLKGRLEARTAYHRFLRLGDGAYLPVVIRDLMDAWSFDRAVKALELAEEAIDAARDHDLREGTSVLPVVGARLAATDSLKSLRRLRRAVIDDPESFAPPPTTVDDAA